jgi:nucleoid-associated protein YgaU
LAPLDDEPDVMATTHHVADGDTLADLAKRYLRDPSRANEIYELNRALIPDPELLPIGVELRLPRRNPPAVDQPASADAIRDSAE